MEVLYEDNHIIIVNKAAGELVQSDAEGNPGLEDEVKKYLKEKYGKPGEAFLGVVHRIDRPVSGVVMFAKTSKALNRLNTMIRDRQVRKIYWAIVKNPISPESGTLHDFIYRDGAKNKSYCASKGRKDAKEAILHYNTISSSKNYHLLEIELETGRHHQIRCQLSHAGSPIRGDLKYGYDRSNPDGSISLHARSLQFIHPVSKQEIAVTAPVPDDNLWKAIEI